ncbi:endo-1,4-beta-xylanase 5-like [Cryptomeria japonica]|uniref:endo-1,4-beta-xylanase 5-like n=1 Tax=Cryptomeria japonica TaxID=3369 RepID=UPI0027DA433E|nr:endo-1,4-beta-xylanase 5-like [Cryptomeria japonica]
MADVGVEIFLDSVSLQPFTKEEWRSHQQANIEKNRKGNVTVHVVDSEGNPVKGAKIMINQIKREFPFGSAIAKTILANDTYQKWFERFNVATFENELKWYSTENQQGYLNYKDADALVEFCNSNNISMRGHNIFWEDPKYTPQWVKDLPDTQQLQSAVESRIRSLVGRYKGQFLNWDVSNEMLHFSFFENKLGPNASLEFFKLAQELDPTTPMFMNDYNTIETCNDIMAIPDEYLRKLQDISSLGVMTGIGLESHFGKANIPLMRSILDRLGSIGLPIWLTEVDIQNSLGGDKQVEYLEEVLREGYSHQFVDGIVMWSALHPYGCYQMCLTDNNFNNLATENVVDKLIEEWNNESIEGITDENGELNFFGFRAYYKAIVMHLELNNSTTFKVSRVSMTTYQSRQIYIVI